jgi:SAM-dependent methyltransferase
MSYINNDYRFGYSNLELERLGIQHSTWERVTEQLWNRAGFRTGMTIVDLGCGPGYTTIDLARLVGPSGHIIAVDRDSEKSLPLLKARLAEEALTNVEIRALELDKLDLIPESVDGVYGRWVMMYLSPQEVEAVVDRATKWMRCNGTFVLVEICNYLNIYVHPKIELLDTVMNAFFQSVKAQGGDPSIGNLLPGMMRRAGLEVDLNVITRAIQPGSKNWSWPDSFFRDHIQSLVEEQRLTTQQCRVFLNEWQARSDNPDSIFFASPVMETLGIKKCIKS